MPVYRFEFETDEQFRARTENPSLTAPDSPPSTESIVAQPLESTTAVPPSVAVEAGSRQGAFLILPWWLIVIFVLVAIIGFYESYRRKLTHILHEHHRALKALPEKRIHATDVHTLTRPSGDVSARGEAPSLGRGQGLATGSRPAESLQKSPADASTTKDSLPGVRTATPVQSPIFAPAMKFDHAVRSSPSHVPANIITPPQKKQLRVSRKRTWKQ